MVSSNTQDTVLNTIIFRSLFEALEQHDLYTFTLNPGTYESVYALSQLPVVVALITIPLNKASFAPLQTDRIGSARPVELMLDGRAPQIRIVTGIERDTHGYWLQTADNLRVHGLSQDRFSGAVVPLGEETGGDEYCQIVSHIVVSALPAVELEGHFEEWYSFMPNTYRKPKIRRAY